jgi:hypothetical protein
MKPLVSPLGVPRAYNFNDFGCPASAKASFGPQRQFTKLSSPQRPTTAAHAPKRRLPKELFEAGRRAAERENITLSDFMRSALAQEEGGVGPP